MNDENFVFLYPLEYKRLIIYNGVWKELPNRKHVHVKINLELGGTKTY